MLVGRGGAVDGSADVRRGSCRGSSGVRGKRNTGNWSVMAREEVGGGELDKQVVQYIADSASTCNTTQDAGGFTNYRECSRPLGLANGGTTSITGDRKLTAAFRSDNGWVHLNLHVVHAPLLSCNLISLPSLTLKGHTYAGDNNGVTLKLKGVGRPYISP